MIDVARPRPWQRSGRHPRRSPALWRASAERCPHPAT